MYVMVGMALPMSTSIFCGEIRKKYQFFLAKKKAPYLKQCKMSTTFFHFIPPQLLRYLEVCTISKIQRTHKGEVLHDNSGIIFSSSA